MRERTYLIWHRVFADAQPEIESKYPPPSSANLSMAELPVVAANRCLDGIEAEEEAERLREGANA